MSPVFLGTHDGDTADDLPARLLSIEQEGREASARIVAAGAVHRPYEGVDEMEKRGNVEVKFYGPDGVTVDLSADGWAGTSVDM